MLPNKKIPNIFNPRSKNEYVKIKSLGKDIRAVDWDNKNKTLKILDQRLIPFKIEFVAVSTVKEACFAIKDMQVRGAPTIGITGAYGLCLSVKHLQSLTNKKKQLDKDFQRLLATRPTAIDLNNCLKEIYEVALDSDFSLQACLAQSHQIGEKIIDECKKLGENGNELIKDKDKILTHCNAGALATLDYGTALAPIRMAHEKGKKVFVYVDETRPRLQGSKITAWELYEAGIDHQIIADSAAAFLMFKGKIDLIVVGADRCLIDGTITNKIGTHSLSLAANYYNIPFYSAFPWSTIDYDTKDRTDIEIELRAPDEITTIKTNKRELKIANPNSDAYNPAFDITPPELITGYITPKGVFNQQELVNELTQREKEKRGKN